MPLPRGMMGRRRLLPCSLLAPPEKIERERRIARIGGTGSKRVARKTERNIPPIARVIERNSMMMEIWKILDCYIFTIFQIFFLLLCMHYGKDVEEFFKISCFRRFCLVSRCDFACIFNLIIYRIWEEENRRFVQLWKINGLLKWNFIV